MVTKMFENKKNFRKISSKVKGWFGRSMKQSGERIPKPPNAEMHTTYFWFVCFFKTSESIK